MRCYLLLTLAIPAFCADSKATAEAQSFFEMKVRPVLAKNCFACHTSSKMGGLEMRSRDTLLKGGKSGPAIVSGDPDHSLLVRAVRQEDEKLKMPPQGKLKDDEISQLAAWVRDGAVWPEGPATGAKAGDYVISPEQRAFWSFQPVRRPEAPKVQTPRWVRNPIDQFILAKLEEKGLTPSAAADRRTLIRRATYDLTGLPPTSEEIAAFLNDRSPKAYEGLIDRLLASPRYGERWGRHWLDVARYSDDKLDPTGETPHPNAYRYRDWVIHAFNEDMPYDMFIKAQIAGDLLADKTKYAAGLGLYALSPEFQDDRVDVTTRGFLGLTVACAQCHDHKFDPIPTKDYYSLLGIFNNTKLDEFPLESAPVVAEYKAKKKSVEEQESAIKEFIGNQSDQLAKIFASHTAEYLMAVAHKESAKSVSLDEEMLKRWANYLKKPQKEHPFLRQWEGLTEKAQEEERTKAAEKFEALVLSVYKEKKAVDEQNLIRLGGSMERGTLAGADLVSLERDKYFLWRDLFGDRGILHYGDPSIDRFLHGEWKEHLDTMRAELDKRKCKVPFPYPFLQIISDVDKPKKQHVYLRGDRNSAGDEVEPHFLSILSQGTPKPFAEKGSGRLSLAEAIANPANPLTSRVMVNRIWQAHFGEGLVRTTSNFGQLGERPTHPELLDYLAWKFVEGKWSMKALHKEIMLSATYQESAMNSTKGESIDAANRFLWKANRKRLDAEEVRDSLLFVSGKLEQTAGGKPERLTEDNRKRTVYGYVSRKKLDTMLALFDFPNPNATAEQRVATNVPLQSLFFLNSPFVIAQSEALAQRLSEEDEAGRIRHAYRLIFGRDASSREVELGREFLGKEVKQGWPKYLQVLLSSNAFLFVD